MERERGRGLVSRRGDGGERERGRGGLVSRRGDGGEREREGGGACE